MDNVKLQFIILLLLILPVCSPKSLITKMLAKFNLENETFIFTADIPLNVCINFCFNILQAEK